MTRETIVSLKESLMATTAGDRPVAFDVTPTPTDATPALPAWLRIETAVREYPFSRASLYRLSAQGRIEILKLGSRSIIRRADLERLLEGLPRLHPRAPPTTTEMSHPLSPHQQATELRDAGV
jgi:hypothetical protein